MGQKIQSFTDLNVWRESHELVISIYTLTKLFPSDERFGLVDQLRRATVSITSNIAEGFARESNLEKKKFYYQSLGSLAEVQNQLFIAKSLGYISPGELTGLAEKTVRVRKLLSGFIKSAKRLP